MPDAPRATLRVPSHAAPHPPTGWERVLTGPDPWLGLAAGALVETCAGGPECEAMCRCEGGR